MKEAKARNPDIKLYGLPWAFPGWLDPNATSSAPTGWINAFADPVATANYTVQWVLGAKRVHNLTIDYVGQWCVILRPNLSHPCTAPDIPFVLACAAGPSAHSVTSTHPARVS